MLLSVSSHAASRLNRAIASLGKEAEVGGLLLGVRGLDGVLVQEITVPQGLKRPSMTSFTLDGKAHMRQAQRLMKASCSTLAVIGIWHTHLCDMDFSDRDYASHRKLTQNIGSAFSLLIVTGMPRWICKAVYMNERYDIQTVLLHGLEKEE